MRPVVLVVAMAVVVVVRIRVLVVTFLAVEDQEVHAERIEGGDEHAERDREVTDRLTRDGWRVVRVWESDVLSDADLRQGLKTYSNWPT